MKHVDVYFDYASPASFLASETAARKLPGVPLKWRPIYLRGLPTFASGVPYDGPKLAYLARDIARCAEHEQVRLLPPARFPVDGLHALRAAYVAEARGAFDRYHPRMFRAVWSEQRDVSDRAVVAALLAEVLGTTTAEAEAMIAEPAVKTRLREETDAAIARGVFGAPSFFVDDELFWGHDRMDYVLRAASGA